MRVDLPTPEEPRKATVRPEVEVVVERGDEEEAVDVGGDDLFGVGVGADGGAGEFGFARENGVDVGVGLAGAETRGDPITNGGEMTAIDGSVAEFTGAVGGNFAVRGEERVGVLVFEGDAPGDEIGSGGSERSAGLGEKIVPPESRELYGSARKQEALRAESLELRDGGWKMRDGARMDAVVREGRK